MARVFIGTNVLFPFSVMDLMLALSEDGIHDVMWSDSLLDEWERVIVREHHRSPDAAAAITATIRQFFADTHIPVESYQALAAEVDGPDPDDNTHMAAAVAGRAAPGGADPARHDGRGWPGAMARSVALNGR